VAGAGVGLLIGVAPGRWDAVILLGVAVVVTAVVGALVRGPAPPRPPRPALTGRQVLALASLYLAMGSTLVFRQRTATELASNPLDLAGQFRVICLLGAFALACVSMLSRRFTLRGVPLAGWLVVAYVGVVPLGTIEAVSVSLVMFKWVELVTFVVVWLAVTRAFPEDTSVPLRHFGIAIGAQVAMILGGIVLFPSQAVVGADAFIPVQIRGYLPTMAANDVGSMGLVVAAFGLGARRINAGLVALGLALVLASQYRTGYVAFLAMVVTVLVLRRAAAARFALVVLAVALPLAAQSSFIEQVWLRDQGSAASLSTLTGRTVWWGEAIDVADRSPLVGIGLSSGVRFEVLQARFNGFTSSIHSTWVEAYVGTGLIGVGLLALAALLAGLGALRRVAWDHHLLPAVLMSMLLVKSITGSTFEIGGQLFILFLLTISAAADRPVPDLAPSGPSPAALGSAG
jgi:O-antigen ligase